jgi:N-acetyl-alpha-D-glucosaminyl L-malate synthase BshA
MKVGIVLYPTYGGSGIVATELGIELAKKGHEIHFITYSQPVRLDVFQPNVFYHEVSMFDYPLFDYQPYELVLTSKMVDVVMNEGLDLLHVHYAIPHASAAYFAQQILKSKGIEIPFITTLHGTDITLVGKDPSFEPVITFSINESNAVTVVSESLKNDTYKHFDINNDIKVIPNFIRTDNYHPSNFNCKRIELAPNNERIIAHVSNFRKVKRVEDVIKTFKIVNEQIPSKLFLIGDGPERLELEQLCRELGVCNDVRMLGKVQNVAELLSMSDLFILSSETESFGLSALEAQASHTPVISTNTGGLPEVNRQGYSGFLSNVGDVEDMAKNAIKILKDDKVLNKFKNNAYQNALKFEIDEILPQYEELYNQVCCSLKNNKG